jgi:hypothetical protein
VDDVCTSGTTEDAVVDEGLAEGLRERPGVGRDAEVENLVIATASPAHGD